MNPDQTTRYRTRFAPNDRVAFDYRRRRMEGTIVRTNPKRALVRVDNEEFTVPYERLIIPREIAEQRELRVESISRTAKELIDVHGLDGWRFRFDHSTRRAGCCNYRDRLITLSINLAIHGSEADIRDTILHEIAHALVGRKHNHDAVWAAMAREIGCSGERTHRLEFAPPRWKVRCENNCWSQTAQRRNRRLVCRRCGGQLIYSAC